MILNKQFLYIACIATVLMACMSNDGQTTKSKAQQKSSFIDQRFSGVLPCPSCPGIATHIYFGKDSTVFKHQVYQEQAVNPRIEYGRWSVQDSIIWVHYDAKVRPDKYKFENNQLKHLALDGTEILGELATAYILNTKAFPDANSILGTYKHEDGALKLKIEQATTEGSAPRFKINIEDRQACSFEGTSKIQDAMLEVDLKALHDQLDGHIVIDFNTEKPRVYTKALRHANHLYYFCKGTKSLAGVYVRDNTK